jgi:hypothetical protein
MTRPSTASSSLAAIPGTGLQIHGYRQKVHTWSPDWKRVKIVIVDTRLSPNTQVRDVEVVVVQQALHNKKSAFAPCKRERAERGRQREKGGCKDLMV